MQAAEASDYHHHKGQDEDVLAHPQDRCLSWHHNRPPETRHHAAQRKSLHVHFPDIDTQRRSHTHVLRSSPQQHPKFGAIDKRPEQDRRHAADRDDDEIVGRIQRPKKSYTAE